MNRYMGAVLTVAACFGLGAPALARAQVSPAMRCQNENAQVSVTFNGIDKDISVIKSKLDSKIAEIKALGAEQQFTKFEIQSFNYNINANYNAASGGETQFQYNGNVSFSVLPADKAPDFMALLVKKGYQARLSVNSYNNGNCAQESLK
jgi:hypothetical protein